ncbi:FtsX-like permease family protein [Goodfellowiella coeruleoviolacea]|uniref:ABC transport system permease protein n=1 Tax=Goodfellowiella coeruleoviolacea TaxID=334858 RepID=A0AAE3KJY3_9PSEU|nr:ABC transporter permease [Goodfellowiella coeruleoviolacea]MCP2164843.1 putative ABC transport system permease protein [Goodfellowiella coeruleoviolacea]
MLLLSLRSLRRQPARFAASLLATFLGATILMSFASLLDTRVAGAVDPDSAKTLVLMASVVGGWGLVIVLFAVLSTLSLLVSQRAAEMALLKSIGATPAQIGLMVVGEALAVAAVGALAAILPADLGGGLVVHLLHNTGQLAPDVTHRFGAIAICLGFGITLVAAGVAAVLAARRTTRTNARDALLVAATGQRPVPRARIISGVVFLVAGLSCGITTAVALRGGGVETMAVGAQGAIFAAIGFALLAPVLLRAVIAVLAGPLRVLPGVSGYLTERNVRGQLQKMAGAVVPIILFTGISTGTLYMQEIENSAKAMTGAVQTVADRNTETLNLVVVGMLAVFAGIMVINTLVAATTFRRREFGQQRLIGATPPQVLRMVGLEGAVLVFTGVLLGSLAATVTVFPYSVAKLGTFAPDTSIALYLAVVLAAVALTLGSSVGTARRVIRTPAVAAATTRI